LIRTPSGDGVTSTPSAGIRHPHRHRAGRASDGIAQRDLTVTPPARRSRHAEATARAARRAAERADLDPVLVVDLDRPRRRVDVTRLMPHRRATRETD
jgi:hypothetical protein